jgi:hypothetical protein
MIEKSLRKYKVLITKVPSRVGTPQHQTRDTKA